MLQATSIDILRFNFISYMYLETPFYDKTVNIGFFFQKWVFDIENINCLHGKNESRNLLSCLD